MEQPCLWDQPINPIIPVKRMDSVEESFRIFDENNPHVMELIVRIALDLKRRGHKRGSIAMIFERLRWMHYVQTQGSAFKLDNNFKPFYSRAVMEQVSELAGWFELREGKHQE